MIMPKVCHGIIKARSTKAYGLSMETAGVEPASKGSATSASTRVD